MHQEMEEGKSEHRISKVHGVALLARCEEHRWTANLGGQWMRAASQGLLVMIYWKWSLSRTAQRSAHWSVSWALLEAATHAHRWERCVWRSAFALRKDSVSISSVATSESSGKVNSLSAVRELCIEIYLCAKDRHTGITLLKPIPALVRSALVHVFVKTLEHKGLRMDGRSRSWKRYRGWNCRGFVLFKGT